MNVDRVDNFSEVERFSSLSDGYGLGSLDYQDISSLGNTQQGSSGLDTFLPSLTIGEPEEVAGRLPGNLPRPVPVQEDPSDLPDDQTLL